MARVTLYKERKQGQPRNVATGDGGYAYVPLNSRQYVEFVTKPQTKKYRGFSKDQVGSFIDGTNMLDTSIYGRNTPTGNVAANIEKSTNQSHGQQRYNIRKAFGLSVG